MATISESLLYLKKQKNEYRNVKTSGLLKDHFKSLKHGLQFLDEMYFVSMNEDLDWRIRRVVGSVLAELRSLSEGPANESRVLVLDRIYSKLREMMKNVIINPDTGEYDVIFLKLSRKVKYFIGFNKFLVKSVQYLSRNWADVIPTLLKEKLFFLEALLKYMANIGDHYVVGSEEVYTTLHALLDKPACLVYSCLVDKMDKEIKTAMLHSLSDLLEKNMVKNIYMEVSRTSKFWDLKENPFGSELYLLDSLIEILKCDISFVVYQKLSSAKVHDMLNVLHRILASMPHELIIEEFSYLVTFTEAIISEAILTIYSCYDEDMTKDMARKVNRSLSMLLYQIEDLQMMVRDREVSEMKLYTYSKTDGLGFLNLFLTHLEELLNCQPESIEDLENEIGELLGAFESLGSFLRKIQKQRYEYAELEDLWTRIIGLAYEAEYIIDLFLVKGASDSRILFSISNVIEKTELIMSEVKRTYDVDKYSVQTHDIAKSSIHLPSIIDSYAKFDKVVVGFEDEAVTIMGYLSGGSMERDVISIVGVAGLGKTTLAKKIFESPLLSEHFHIRAWCTVSQTYQKENLLRTILGNVAEISDEIEKLNTEELTYKLYNMLKGRRYLIVLDDVWDSRAWNDLVRSFPDDNNHSRILITTRFHIVASQVKDSRKVHRLRSFSNHESWELFQMKLFVRESFSQEFLDVGKQIAYSCKGLPLSIVLATGILANLEWNIDLWKQVARSLSSHIFSDYETQCMVICELSYKLLPDHLKSCFLYIGVFLKVNDADISVKKLKRLWIVEGFVRDNKSKSMEDVAEEYLMELISRRLVTATEESSRGGVKACAVRDIFRVFILKKAEEESFLKVVNKGDTDGISLVYHQRRICFYCDSEDLDKAKPSSRSVRSLFNSYPRKERMINISQKFMLLRVLDIGFLEMNDSFEGIISLIHLKYLSFTSRGRNIPSSIANLLNLQYLRIRNYLESREVIKIPDSLWDIVNLRNVSIDSIASFDFYSKRVWNSYIHHLETLSTPCFNSQEDAENLLRGLPNLQKLNCVFMCRNSSFPEGVNLTFLHQLISLKVNFDSWPLIDRMSFRCELHLPLNLEKLTLSASCLSWYGLSKIGESLHNLKVLKLIGDFADTTWNMNEWDFPALKYLRLINSNIRAWNASQESFPFLEQLVLERCRMLQEIPPCFGESSTLQMIVVKSCNSPLNDSARRIEKEQLEEWGNYDFKVNITPSNFY